MKKQVLTIATAILNCAFLIFNCPQARAQIISTYAGNGTPSFAGDGGQATLAELNYPTGVAVDAAGNVYIADDNNNRIRKVSTAGIISTFAGNGIGSYTGDGGPATAAKLFRPTGIMVDASGNVYIADGGNNVIRKVSTAGIISTFAGNGIGGYAGNGGSATVAKLTTPWGIALDGFGNLYIADMGNSLIRMVNSNGIISTFAGDTTGSYLGSGGGYSGDGGYATNAKLNQPFGVAFDAAGNVYIADEGNNRIRKVNTNGIISTIAGDGTGGVFGDGSLATDAQLNQPTGISIDAIGNIYIADFANNRVRLINTNGIISTIVGDGTAGFSGDGGIAINAELSNPQGIALDIVSNIYIADRTNMRIRKVCVSACAGAGIEELRIQNAAFSIYPNPTNSVINVELGVMSETTKVEVLNTLGEVVIGFAELTFHNSSLKTHNLALDVSGLPAGVYFMRVGTATQKFIKQ